MIQDETWCCFHGCRRANVHPSSRAERIDILQSCDQRTSTTILLSAFPIDD